MKKLHGPECNTIPREEVGKVGGNEAAERIENSPDNLVTEATMIPLRHILISVASSGGRRGALWEDLWLREGGRLN